MPVSFSSTQSYFKPPVLSVFILGISSGLPWVMIGSALTLWLKEAGISRSAIGFAGLIFTLYAIHFLWAPLVDAWPLFKHKTIGHMRSWILGCQALVVVCCVLMAYSSPASLGRLITLAFALALASSTLDVAVDAYRIDTLEGQDTKTLSASSAAVTAGWWTGYAGLGGVPLWLSDLGWNWPQLYFLMAGLMAAVFMLCWLLPDAPRHPRGASTALPRFLALTAGLPKAKQLRLCVFLLLPWAVALWGLLDAPGVNLGRALWPVVILLELALLGLLTRELFGLLRPKASSHYRATPITRMAAHLLATLIAPLEEFFTRKGTRFALMILAFLLLFKLGEAFLGRMSIVFYKEVGFSNSDIATYSKFLTWWATVLFAIPCAFINARLSVFKALFISACAMALSNLLFSWIALAGPKVNLLVAAVLIDGFTQSWSTIAFVSFVSRLCNRAFSATQYTLFAALATLGRTTLAANSGVVVDMLGGNWALFFVLTTLMVLPGLGVLWWARRELSQL